MKGFWSLWAEQDRWGTYYLDPTEPTFFGAPYYVLKKVGYVGLRYTIVYSTRLFPTALYYRYYIASYCTLRC